MGLFGLDIQGVQVSDLSNASCKRRVSCEGLGKPQPLTIQVCSLIPAQEGMAHSKLELLSIHASPLAGCGQSTSRRAFLGSCD